MLTTSQLQEALDKTRSELLASQEELTKLRKQHRATVQSASEEIKQLRTSIADLAMKLRIAEGKLAGARGRAMRKEKMALKNSTRFTSQADELL